MPSNLSIGAFAFGAVLLLLALTGGGFKLFGAEVSGGIGKVLRAIAGAIGTVFVVATAAPILMDGHAMGENEVGFDRPGSDLRDVVLQDVDECRAVCVRDPMCLAVTFNTGSMQCWLKNQVPLRHEAEGFISAVKQ